MSAHTPGPWKVISEEAAREVYVFEVAEVSHFLVIRDCMGDGFDAAGDALCDARLIAAAPELLAALQAAVELYGQPGGPWNVPGSAGSWIAQARDAIAKATGSTS